MCCCKKKPRRPGFNWESFGIFPSFPKRNNSKTGNAITPTEKCVKQVASSLAAPSHPAVMNGSRCQRRRWGGGEVGGGVFHRRCEARRRRSAGLARAEMNSGEPTPSSPEVAIWSCQGGRGGGGEITSAQQLQLTASPPHVVARITPGVNGSFN